MAQSVKIEDRTKEFNKAMKTLLAIGEVKTQKELADALGISVSKLTEIKKERQNIQPDEWEKFKKKYKWPRENISDISVVSDDRDILIVELKQDILNLKASNRVNTKLLKKLMGEVFKKDSSSVDEEYSNELLRTLPQG